MSRLRGAIDVRRGLRVAPFALALAALMALAAAPAGSARVKPTCFGQTATIVDTNGADPVPLRDGRG